MSCRSEQPAVLPQSAYALRWLDACAVLATVGVGVGMLLWGPAVALLSVASGTLFVWLLRVCALPQQPGDLPRLCVSSSVVPSSLLMSSGAVGLRALLKLVEARQHMLDVLFDDN